MYNKCLSIGSVLLGILMTTLTAYAQVSVPGQPAPVQYIVAPEVPGPNQLVNIEVQGIGNFLGNSTITWQENGKTVTSGVGLSSFSFTTGAVGSVIDIRLTIDSSTEGIITHDFMFYPSLVSLVWEAKTTVPLFYPGKPLYSAGSPLRVIAFPVVMSGGSLIPSNNLSFQWQENGTPVPNQSGLGATTLTFNGSQLQQSESVSVDVFYGSTKVAHNDISIPATTPQLIFYVQDPLRGELTDVALAGSASLSQQELTLKAEPYYFSQTSASHRALQYTWTLNSQAVTGPTSAQGILTLKQTGSGTGEGQLGVSVQNMDANDYVQSASTELQLLFGQQGGSSISSFFGL